MGISTLLSLLRSPFPVRPGHWGGSCHDRTLGIRQTERVGGPTASGYRIGSARGYLMGVEQTRPSGADLSSRARLNQGALMKPGVDQDRSCSRAKRTAADREVPSLS